MTNESTRAFQVDGTSALQLIDARIIPFPKCQSGHRSHSDKRSSRTVARASKSNAPTVRIPRVLAASEMFCSLLLEDYHGCAYRMFSRRAIAAATALIALVSVLSLLFSC